MLTFKGKITITKGIITDLSPSDSLSIELDGVLHKFPERSTAVVGFVDCHGHVSGYGMRLSETSLKGARSLNECIERLRRSKLMRGGWLTAFGWNHENWDTKQLPTKYDLDFAFPDNPVYLTRQDGHSAIANSAALKIAGINRLTDNPIGGEIVKDENGEPTGLLLDNAMQLVEKHIPDYSLEQYTSFIELGLRELARYGITQAHDMDVETRFIPIFQELELDGRLPIRVKSFVRAQNNEWLRDSVLAYKGKYFSVQGLKYFVDGALGSYGAALWRGYDDAPAKQGFMLLDEQTLFNRAKRGILSGFDVAFHAIGDRAVSCALNVAEKLRQDSLLGGRGRIRIEHAQIILPNDVQRFSELNVIASVQPYHYTSDTNGMAQRRIGSRLRYAYRWKSLLDAKAILIAGSDLPIELPSVMEGLRAFVTRRASLDGQVHSPEERLTMDEALSAYCRTPHLTTNQLNEFGAIEIGKTADITVLSENPHILENEPEAQIDVLATIVGGRVAFKSWG